MLQRVAAIVVCLIAALVLAMPQAGSKPQGGYEGGTELSLPIGRAVYQFNILFKDSDNPDQMTVTGRAISSKAGMPPIEFRGTFFVKTRKLRAFGEIRGEENSLNINLNGTRVAGVDKFIATCTTKGLNDNEANVDRFYLVPGPDVAEGAHVEIILKPNKAIPGQIITGSATINVTNADGPVKLSVSGHVAYQMPDGILLRTPSPNFLKLDLSGNGQHTLDLASLGITFPTGADDPKLVLKVKSSVDLVSQSVRLDQDAPSDPIDIFVFVPMAPPSIKLGETYAFTSSYRVRNLSNNAMKASLTERAWVSKKGEARTELTPTRNWVAELDPKSSESKDTPQFAPFSYKPTSPGTYRLDYEVFGPNVTPHKGFVEFEVLPSATTTPTIKKGDIRGTIKLDKSPIEVQEPSMLTLGYTLSGRPYVEVEEVVEMVGPSGSVVATTRRKRTIEDGVQAVKKWIINATEPGTYRIRTKVTSSDASPLETETALTVKPKSATADKGSPTTPPKAEGTYGLVRKVVGNLPDSGVGPYGTWTGSIAEGSCSMIWTATRDYQGTFNWNSTFSSPPPVLKPGDIIELTCTASASRTSENQPSSGIGAKWYVEGAEVMEATSAFAGPASDGKFYPSNKGKTKFKVGSGGKITLLSNNGIAYGVNGNMNSCTYTYQWNSPPIATKPTTDDDKPIVNTRTGFTPLTPDDPEEETGKLRAFVDKPVLTLRAGEIGEIVDLHISGFRTRTEDRVEVIFPDKTDNWASLPGGIVVTGGNGSYWPPNMNRPEHVDGYFFRARSTAQTGTRTINIIVRQAKAGEVRLSMTINVIGKSEAGPTNPPPTTGKTWAGTWSSNFDDMKLTQNGDEVTGTFGVDNYKFVGKVKGNTLTFKIYDGKDEFGGGSLTMSDDGNSFKGDLTVAGNDKLEWTGKRKKT